MGELDRRRDLVSKEEARPVRPGPRRTGDGISPCSLYEEVSISRYYSYEEVIPPQEVSFSRYNSYEEVIPPH